MLSYLSGPGICILTLGMELLYYSSVLTERNSIKLSTVVILISTLTNSVPVFPFVQITNAFSIYFCFAVRYFWAEEYLMMI